MEHHTFERVISGTALGLAGLMVLTPPADAAGALTAGAASPLTVGLGLVLSWAGAKILRPGERNL